MIRSFRHKGLAMYFGKSDSRRLPTDRIARIGRWLDRLDSSIRPEDMQLSGFGWHALKGSREGAYAVEVSGNRRLTFRVDGANAIDVDLEDYR